VLPSENDDAGWLSSGCVLQIEVAWLHKAKLPERLANRSGISLLLDKLLQEKPRDVTRNHQAHKPTRKSKRTLERLTGALHQRAQHDDATLPTVMLIER